MTTGSSQKRYVKVGLLVLMTLADNGDNTTAISDHVNQTCKVILSGRTFYKNVWNTLCLPFSLTAEQVAAQLAPTKLMELDTKGTYTDDENVNHQTGLEGTTLYLYFTKATTISAGKPYLIKWASGENIENPVFTAVIIDKTMHDVEFTGGKFVGTYSYTKYMEEDKSILFLGSNNTLYYPQPDTSNPDEPKYPSIGAFRAYFQLGNGITAGDVSDVRLFFNDSEATGIFDVERLTFNVQRDNAWHTLDGRQLQGKPTRHGLYIHGGRKVVVK